MTQHHNAKTHLKKYAQSIKGKEKIRKYNNTIRSRWNRAHFEAKKKGVVFELTFSEYEAAIAPPCFYCNDYFDMRSETGIGLDRSNNLLGYVLGNVVPCCKRCNTMKSNWMSSEETKAVIELIIKMRTVLDLFAR